MSLMNAWNDFPYRPRYYLTHPWRFFQEIWWNFKAGVARVRKGHAWRDSAEMDEYLLHLIPSMLRDIANGYAYPGVEPFETPEKWTDWCNSLADVFESVWEENWYEGRNEWADKFEEAFLVRHPHPNITMTTTMTKEEADEICQLYHEREQELAEEREKIIQDAYVQLIKYHSMLWI